MGKLKASQPGNDQDVDAIKQDITSFASKLGFVSSAENGFDDSDFKKKGALRGAQTKPNAQPKGHDKTRASHEAGSKKEFKGRFKATALDGDKSKRNFKPSSKKTAFEKRGRIHENGSSKLNGVNRRVDDLSNESLNDSSTPNSSLEETPKLNVKTIRWNFDSDDKTGMYIPKKWYEVSDELAKTLLEKSMSNVSATQETQKGKKKKKNQNDTQQPLALNVNAPQGKEVVGSMLKEGEALIQALADRERIIKSKDEDAMWLETVRRSGTSADRTAALTISVQEDPVANLNALDSLINMLSSKIGKRHAVTAIDSLQELLLLSLLPDRKLKFLSSQPIHILKDRHGNEEKRLLLLWYFEHCLKNRCETFVSCLEECLKDPLLYLKEKSLKTVFELLIKKPENEKKLLFLLINKFGDTERKVSSKVCYFLSLLLTNHPGMKNVVVNEIDNFLFRPNQTLRARHYAVAFLNQIVLDHKPESQILAKRLIDIYFSLFKLLSQNGGVENEKNKGKNVGGHGKIGRGKGRDKKSKGENKRKEKEDEELESVSDHRIFSSLLVGVNRAFPFVPRTELDQVLKIHTPALFKMVYSKNFNICIHSLRLIQQLLHSQNEMSARFYRAIYAILLSSSLVKSSKISIFMSIVFKAIKSDVNIKRISAFCKRLFQISFHVSSPLSCSILILISNIFKLKPTLWNAILHPEDDDSEEKFVDLDKLLEPEINENEERSAKDKITNNVQIQPEYNDMRNESETKSIATESSKPRDLELSEKIDLGDDVIDEEEEEDDEDEEDENKDDYSEEDSESNEEEFEKYEKKYEVGNGVKSSQDERSAKLFREKSANKSEGGEETNRNAISGKSKSNGHIQNQLEPEQDKKKSTDYYDPKAREPLYCHADRSCFWELNILGIHFHPSVTALANSLLNHSPISYHGDPVYDLTLSVFLDRFVERKPKIRRVQKTKDSGIGAEDEDKELALRTRGHSWMQPLRKSQDVSSLAVGYNEFMNLNDVNISADNAFFHKFYSIKALEGTKKKKKVKPILDQDEDGFDVLDSDDDTNTKDVDSELEEEEDDEDDEEEISDLLQRELKKELGGGKYDSEEDDFDEDDFDERELEGMDMEESDEEDLDINQYDDIGDQSDSDDISPPTDKGIHSKKRKSGKAKEVEGKMKKSKVGSIEEEDEEDDVVIDDIEMDDTISEKLSTGKNKWKKKQSKQSKAGGSVFADFEEYAHLLN